MIEALGLASRCPDYFPLGPGSSCNIPEDQFDNLFMVTVQRFSRDARIVKAKYGN
jgi:hypothetical protein